MIDQSIVICTRDRWQELEETLDAVARQQLPEATEVLVVDNGSRDATAAGVGRRAAAYPVALRLASEPRAGVSFARNRALEAARGRIILFLDDDVSPEPGWAAAMARAFADPGVVAAGGRVLPRLPAAVPEWFAAILRADRGGPTSRYDFGEDESLVPGRRMPLPFGANMAAVREQALAAGGFSPRLGWGARRVPGEDVEFMRRLRAAGRIVYVPAAQVIHRIAPERATPAYDRLWQRGYGRASALVDGSARRMSPAVLASLAGFLGYGLLAAARLGLRDRRGAHLAARRRERFLGRWLEQVAGAPPPAPGDVQAGRSPGR